MPTGMNKIKIKKVNLKIKILRETKEERIRRMWRGLGMRSYHVDVYKEEQEKGV